MLSNNGQPAPDDLRRLLVTEDFRTVDLNTRKHMEVQTRQQERKTDLDMF